MRVHVCGCCLYLKRSDAPADGRRVDEVVRSLRAAVAAAPEDVALRVHLGELLLEAGLVSEAVQEAAEALRLAPDSSPAQALMRQAVALPEPMEESRRPTRFDWEAAEEELAEVSMPMFVDTPAEETPRDVWEVERSAVRLDMVGGMVDVKERLEMSFLAPLRNPELRRLYGKSLRGGLLLYGPPGCGKSYLARALAGKSRPASSRSRSTTCLTCGSERVSGTCTKSSSWRDEAPRALSSSTSWMRSGVGARSFRPTACAQR
jgi:hypothetical protein